MSTAPIETGPNEVDAYAKAVLAGDVLAGKLARLACERHMRDRKDGERRGLTFDNKAAKMAIGFCQLLCHSKGEWAGHTLKLEPWQKFIVGSLFGWKRADGTRRYRMAYDELSRKNGKSTVAAAVGLYLAFFSGEAGAEVYTAATKRDQARIVHEEAIRMVKKSAWIRDQVKVSRDNLCSPASNSKYEPLGADADTLDGLNISGAIVDELHAHKTRALLDVLETATGARREPLIFIITTAGSSKVSVCWELHEYAVKILTGLIEDDSFFAFIATIDEGDSWTDPSCWAKANPNLGVSVKLEDLQRKALKAREMPSAENAFKRLHLDVWTEGETRWLSMDLWDACPAPFLDDRREGWKESPLVKALGGRESWWGLDLANTMDLASAVGVFPDAESGCVDVLAWFWTPEEAAKQRTRQGRQSIDQWIKLGFIEATQGDVIDYGAIRRTLREISEFFLVRDMRYDPWNATQLATELEGDAIYTVKFPQTYSNYNEPCTAIQEAIKGGKMRHGRNPVLRWMASNVVLRINPGTGHFMPSRKLSTEKIDGMCALAMAWAGLVANPDRSVYEDRGIMTL